MTEKELMEKVEAKVGEVVAAQIKDHLNEQTDEFIKGQLKEHIEDTLKKIQPAPDEKAVNDAVKEKKFSRFGEQLSAIWQARHLGKMDERLKWLDSNGKLTAPDLSQKAMTEGTDSGGGFLVFTEDRAQILEIALENAIVRPNGAMVFPMGSDSLQIPRVDDTTHVAASGVFGGVIAYWTEEAGTKTASQPKWGQCKLNAHELAGYTVASNALLADSAIALEPYIRRAFGTAWGYFEDVAFLAGTGVGEPLGITNAACLVSVTRQANNAVYIEDFINLYSRMLPASRDRAVWIMNHEVLKEVIGLSTSNATLAAGANMIWIDPNQGMVKKPLGTILGRPFFVTEKVPAIGSASDLIFADLSYYLIGDRQALTIDASTHVYFTSNQTAWRFVIRCDGQPWPAAALTPRNGTATLSPFVALSSSS